MHQLTPAAPLTIRLRPAQPARDGGRARLLERARLALSRAEAAFADSRIDASLAEYDRAARLALEVPGAGAIRADALRGSAIVCMSRSDWLAAEEDFRRSRDEARRIGDEERMGKAENGLAAVAFERGHWESATDHFAAARSHAEAAEDALLLAQIEQNEGALHAARGDTRQAEACYRRALARFEELGSHPCAARTWNNLGLALMTQGRPDEARDAFERSLVECRRQGDEHLAVKVLINSGRLELRRGRAKEAHVLALRAWTFAERLAKGPVAAGALCLMGEVALAMGDRATATTHLGDALSRVDKRKAPLVEAEIWIQLGHLSAESGNRESALESWRYARHLYRLLGADAEVDRVLELIESRSRAWENETELEAMKVDAA